MSSTDEFEVVDVHELVRDTSAEQPACAAWTDGPPLHILRVWPHQVTERTFISVNHNYIKPFLFNRVKQLLVFTPISLKCFILL